MSVTIYSTTTCPYCKMLKDYLGENKITYEEKFVDQDDVAREEMMENSGGFLGVPFTVVEKDGNKTTVIGFNKKKINETLGLEG